jgi:phage gp16-like protein
VNSSSKTLSNRSRLIQLVHIGKSQLLMADDSYRALLAYHSDGKTSSTKLTATELQAVFDAMVKLGFKATKKTVKPGQKRLSPTSADGPQDVRAVIRAVWVFMAKAEFLNNGSETALNSWVQRMTAEMNGGMGVAEVQWLQDDMAVKVLESLKRWCRRAMFNALRSDGHEIHPQASYSQVLSKWQRVYEGQSA